MKIAMIGLKGIPSRAGGIEIHVEEIAKRLERLGCRVDVYCRKDYCRNVPFDNTTYPGINIKYAPYLRSKNLEAISHTFFSTIKALFSDCDIFHYHALGPSTFAFIPKIFGRKVVCTVHGLDWQRSKWGGFASRYLKFGEYATAKFPASTISVSENLVDYYMNKYGKKLTYIPNGIEKPEYREAEVIQKRYGLDKDSYILFLSRLVPEKGAHFLINAFKKIDTDKRLVIAGGSSYSDNYERELHKLAEDDDRIVFTGHVEGQELAELYSNAYFYVLPSEIEGLPISLLEAMSYGNCCLTSDIPENRSVVGEFGYTFTKSSEEDLRNQLIWILHNEEAIKSIKSMVQKYVLRKYNWEDITMRLYEIYQKLCMKQME